MANEVTVPILPCASIDVIAEFFGMADFDPEESYGTCIVQVPDVGSLHKAFAAGLRAAYGKVPVSGIPRMTRPRRRKNSGNLSGLTVVDPGGNWIRIFPAAASAGPAPTGKLGKALENAVVMGDSHGDARQAAKILDGALRRAVEATVDERVEALTYRAELAVRLGEEVSAAEVVAELRGLPLTAEDRARLAKPLAAAEELASGQR